MVHYVYVLRSLSRPDKTYVGESNDPLRRLGEHNSEENEGWTSRHPPWEIEAYVLTDTEETAKIAERYFKSPSGKEKWANFKRANPLHPNPIQGFFDTLGHGRWFGSGERRFYAKRITKRDGTGRVVESRIVLTLENPEREQQ